MVISLNGTRRAIRRCVTAAPVALALALPAAAPAQVDPGVNYDPGSPAGKEYAIPLVLGRAEGAGTEDQRAAANTPFGVGITPPGARGGGGDGDEAGAGGSGREDGADGAAGGTTGSGGESPADRRAAILRAEEPGGAGFWTIGIGLAVLLSALAFAVALGPGRVHRAA